MPDDLHYQFVPYLEKEGLIILKGLYIDRTKIEADANRYTFVWRGTINFHPTDLLDTIGTLYTRYNALLPKNGYGHKYGFGNTQAFIIEEMNKVRKVIRKNRNPRKKHP